MEEKMIIKHRGIAPQIDPSAYMSVGFANVAFNINTTGKSKAEIYKEATRVRSKEYNSHSKDKII